jgi:outer membrane protein assembly factor BamB
VWERRDIKVNHYRGPGSSPIVFRDLLIMHFDGSDAQFVIALDKNTGKTVWQTPRSVDFGDLLPDGKPIREGDFRKAFSTPFLAELDGRPTLLSAASKATYAYDPVTGKELWRVEDKRFHSGSASPTAGHGLVFTCTGLARGELWAVRPGRGVLTEADVIWKVNRNVPTQPSPLLLGDLLFTIDDGGIASCLEAKTGKEIWRERVGGNYSASPICADGRLYFFSRDGKGTVVAAGGEFKMLGESQLDDGFMATPAIAGKALFARGKANLYRIEESPATAK